MTNFQVLKWCNWTLAYVKINAKTWITRQCAGVFQRQLVISKRLIRIDRTLKAGETRQVTSQRPRPLRLLITPLLTLSILPGLPSRLDSRHFSWSGGDNSTLAPKRNIHTMKGNSLHNSCCSIIRPALLSLIFPIPFIYHAVFWWLLYKSKWRL